MSLKWIELELKSNRGKKSIMLCQRPKITLFYCQNHTILCLDRFKACCYLFSSYCRLFFYFCQKTKRMLALSVATKTNWFFITADPLKFGFAVDLTNFQLKLDQTERFMLLNGLLSSENYTQVWAMRYPWILDLIREGVKVFP